MYQERIADFPPENPQSALGALILIVHCPNGLANSAIYFVERSHLTHIVKEAIPDQGIYFNLPWNKPIIEFSRIESIANFFCESFHRNRNFVKEF